LQPSFLQSHRALVSVSVSTGVEFRDRRAGSAPTGFSSNEVRFSIRDSAMSTAHGTLQVFTFKEGILARAAHDLRLSLERFQVSLDQDTLSAAFETASLRVDGTMRGG